MKDLAYLNKYFLKYKWHLILGTIFIIISNFFGIIPAVVVRYSFDLLQRNYEIFKSFDGFDLQTGIYSTFASTILLLGVVILVSSLLQGVFMFFMRQDNHRDVSIGGV